MDLTHENVKRHLHYNRFTGVFRWRTSSRGRKAGDLAGTLSGGYIHIRFFEHRVLGHRLAWFYVYGVWPKGKLDHKDRVRSNNRIRNLREATNSENSQNTSVRKDNILGLRNISLVRRRNRYYYRVLIRVGTQRYLRYFSTKDKAVYERNLARKRLHEFATQ